MEEGDSASAFELLIPFSYLPVSLPSYLFFFENNSYYLKSTRFIVESTYLVQILAQLLVFKFSGKCYLAIFEEEIKKQS